MSKRLRETLGSRWSLLTGSLLVITAIGLLAINQAPANNRGGPEDAGPRTTITTIDTVTVLELAPDRHDCSYAIAVGDFLSFVTYADQPDPVREFPGRLSNASLLELTGVYAGGGFCGTPHCPNRSYHYRAVAPGTVQAHDFQ